MIFSGKSKRKTELVVWLAHSEELCEQAAEEFEKAWANLGNRSINVVRHFRPHTNGVLTTTENAFIVMSLQSAHSMAFSQSRDREFFELAKSVGLTVIDEAHKATAETYQHVLELLAPVDAANLLGLTATPGRELVDVEEDTKLATFFLRNKLSLEIEGYENPIDYLREEGYLAHQETVKIEYNGTNMVSHKDLRFGDFTKEQLELIGKDQARNIRIIDAIEKEAEHNAQIIVFACSVKHARLLTAILVVKKL